MWIDNNSWHARVYLWWYDRKFCLWEKQRLGVVTVMLPSVNLCPYVRTVLFWAPIRWLTMWGPRKVGVAIETVGWMGLFWLCTIIPVKSEEDFGALAAFLIFWLLLLGIRGGVFLGTHNVTFPSPPDIVVEKGASFFILLGGYISKAHTQICPQIELRDGGQK